MPNIIRAYRCILCIPTLLLENSKTESNNFGDSVILYQQGEVLCLNTVGTHPT